MGQIVAGLIALVSLLKEVRPLIRLFLLRRQSAKVAEQAKREVSQNDGIEKAKKENDTSEVLQ